LNQWQSFIFQFLKIFNHAGFSKWRPKNPVKKQLLQFTAPKAKNRQNFAGGRPPGMFIEA
jgi:hypothetical protein